MDELAKVVDRFAGIPVAVVGDLVADLYVHGVPSRVSREAPVLVLSFEREELIPGGAANTANNLLSLGAEVFPIGLLGDDGYGRALVEYFEERGVATDGLVLSPDFRTVTKTRVLAGSPTRWKTQIVRIDREPERSLPPGAAGAILTRVREVAGRVGAVIFSDYGYGVAAPGVAGMVECIRVADSRFRIDQFKGFTALTPNEEEAAAIVGHRVLSDGQVRTAGRELLRRTEAGSVLVTRGNRGMALFTADGEELFLSASGKGDVTDVTGAGDTVTGVLTLALAAGATPPQAARLANHAAGIVVTRAGAATLRPEELRRRVEESA